MLVRELHRGSSVHPPLGDRQGRPRNGHRRIGPELRSRSQGRLYRRGIGQDDRLAGRRICDPRPQRAPRILRRDEPDAEQENGSGLREQPRTDLLRGREARGPRGRQTLRRRTCPDRRSGLQPDARAVLETDRRIRTGMGHRYGQDGYGRSGTGDARLHPSGARREVRQRSRPDRYPLRRQREAGQRSRAFLERGRRRRSWPTTSSRSARHSSKPFDLPHKAGTRWAPAFLYCLHSTVPILVFSTLPDSPPEISSAGEDSAEAKSDAHSAVASRDWRI